MTNDHRMCINVRMDLNLIENVISNLKLHVILQKNIFYSWEV